MKRIKDWSISAIITIISVSAAIFLGEFLFRMSPFAKDSQILNFPRYYWTADSELGYDISRNHIPIDHVFADGNFKIWSNSLGCFDSDYDKSSFEDFIYITGDSFTWGFTSFEDKWMSILENKTGIRALKCGVDGFGTRQELIKTKRVLGEIKNTPKVIMVGYLGANDIEDDSRFPNFTIYSGYRIPSEYIYPEMSVLQKVKVWISVHSALFNAVKWNLRRFTLSILPDSILDSTGLIKNQAKEKGSVGSIGIFEGNFSNILEFKKLAQEKNSKLVFVLIPSKNDLNTNGKKSDYSNFNTREFLDMENISYIDLFDHFKTFNNPKNLYWPTDGHWNVLGNKLAGLIISRFLVSSGFIKIENSEEVLRKIESELELERDFGFLFK